jgi:large subunit ribosomal protein L10
MSKEIKQMQMDSLKDTFKDVQDLVVFSATGVDCQTDNQLRLTLRKKQIRMQVVKNSLCRRVFDEMGIKGDGFWEGPTLIAWGANSLAELSRTLDSEFKKHPKAKDKFKAKGAIAEGQRVTFEQALKMPTRTEAIGRVIGLVLSPGARLASQLTAPAARVAAQLKTLSEKAEEKPAPAAGEA